MDAGVVRGPDLKNLETKDLPVIIISASRDGERIANDAGVSGFLAKPFDLDTLVNRVDEMIAVGGKKIRSSDFVRAFTTIIARSMRQ